jgi:hypothetical protein
LRKLQRKYLEDERGTERAVAAARGRGATEGEIREIWGGSDGPVLRYRVRTAISDYLIAEADRLMIPLPDKDDQKIWENAERYPVLTRQGINEVRTAIRAERKAQMELFVMWMPTVIGIIGALTGLAAVVLGLRK